MKNKIDLVNDCFSALLRTGVTTQATPDEQERALYKLEDMMAELESRNLATGYNFEDTPQGDSPSGLENWMSLAISESLAVRIWTDFSPEMVNPRLEVAARQSMANLSARLAQQRALQYARRTPLGSGNQPYQQYNKFFGDYGSACGPSDVSSGGCAPVPTPPPLQCSCDVIPLSHLKLLGDEALFGASEKQYSVTGFYDGSTVGGGLFVFNPDGNKSTHNGVTAYAPEALQAWAGTQADIATLLNWTGFGSGVWVRADLHGFVTPEMAGAVGGADDSAAYQSAINYCAASKDALRVVSDASVQNLNISGDVSIESNGNTLSMLAGSSQRRIIRVASGTLTIKGLTLNASAGSVGNVCLLVEGGAVSAQNCQFTGAKLISGYGEGVMVFTSALRQSFVACKFFNNGSDGLTVYDATGVFVDLCESYSNGNGGMIFNNQTTPVGTKKINNVTISNTNCYNNGRSGFGFGNPYNDHNASGDNFGHTNKTCENVKVTNCIANNNEMYGFGISCYKGVFDNIVADSNTFGGILVNGRYIELNGAIVSNNGSYGVDVGFGADININGGSVFFNSVTLNAGGLLLEACLRVNVSGTKVFGNGPINTGWNLIIAGVGGTGDGRYFPAVANQITVACEVDCSDSRNGMRVDDAAESIVDNNTYKGTDPLKYTRYATHTGELNNSGATSKRAYYSKDPSSNILVVPDVEHRVFTNSTSVINSVRPYSYDFFRGKIPYIRTTSQGSGYDAATTTVTITGDGSGAAGSAFVSGGKVIGVRMTNFGSGYTTATATITGGGGSGAVLSAQVNLPLLSSARTTICHNQASSFVMAGPPVINTPSAPTNLTAPNRGAITLIERYGQWIVESSNYAM